MPQLLQHVRSPEPEASGRTEPDVIRSRWPIYGEDEIAEVVDILNSGAVNALHHGQRCAAFERTFAERCAAPHAIAVANGTLALELALRALGVGPGDEVIVPARSFIASASCVVAVGATPVFADVDPDSQALNAMTVAAALTEKTKAIIMVHLAGWIGAIEEVAILADSIGAWLIEDCAQAHGATRNGRPVGSFGDAAAFSFCTDKIMSTGGEGGMLVLRDAQVWARAWAYKDHGKSVALVGGRHSSGAFRWLHSSLGSNYRMTEMQAAIGLRQLTKLNGWIEARRRNAGILDGFLDPLPAVRLPKPLPGVWHAYYKYYAFIEPERLKPGWSRDRIVEALIAAGVPAGTGVCPEIYREKAFAGTPWGPASPLATAQKLGATSLMLPVDPTIDETMAEAMGQRAATVITAASRN